MIWQERRDGAWNPIDPNRPCWTCGSAPIDRYPDGSPHYGCGPHPPSVATPEQQERFAPLIAHDLLTRAPHRIRSAIKVRAEVNETAYGLRRARRSDPKTSHQAARSGGPAGVTEVQGWIFEILAEPMTDEQIWNALSTAHKGQVTPSGARTRRAELVDQGFVQASGLTLPTHTGRASIVWQRSSQERIAFVAS